MEAIQAKFMEIWSEAVDIWSVGGWAMIAIAVISMAMALMGFHVAARLFSRRLNNVPEREWRRWIDNPVLRRGRLGDLFDLVLAEKSTLKDATLHFDQMRASEAAPFERDLKVMKICVSAAPLVGLLGTVTGMLATFSALSSGSGGDQTMGMIAAGISEALITTETGLVVALPGLFFHHFLVQRFENYKLSLSHLETVVTQVIYRRSRDEESEKELVIAELGRKLRQRAALRNGKRTKTPQERMQSHKALSVVLERLKVGKSGQAANA